MAGLLACSAPLATAAANAADEPPATNTDAAAKGQTGTASDAVPPPPPGPTYSGDFWTRSTLTGDWGGARNDLASKGITFNISLTQVELGVVSGGRDTGFEYLGRGEADLTLDTTKMGLWPGGIFSFVAEGHYGDPVSRPHAGSLLPVDVNEFFPEADTCRSESQRTLTKRIKIADHQ